MPVFVFGSNVAGRHGKGAALYARVHYEAESGVGEGLTGRAYAIPTKDAQLRTLPIEQILPAVHRFIEYARANPKMLFDVTPIGCGLAGYRHAWIAPLFSGAPQNCRFTNDAFAALVPRPQVKTRIIVAGPRSLTDQDLVWSVLDRMATRGKFEVVCCEAPGAATLGREWADDRCWRDGNWPQPYSLLAAWDDLEVPCARIKVRRSAGGGQYNTQAGRDCNAWMAAYGTHLLAFWNRKSPRTRNMISLAKSVGLPTKVITTRCAHDEAHSPPR